MARRPGARAARREIAAVLSLPALLASCPGASRAEAPALRSAAVAANVIELQPARRIHAIAIEDGAGRRGRATLVDLEPRVHVWLLLELQWEGEAAPETFHLENPDPQRQRIGLDAAHPQGIVLSAKGAPVEACVLWSASAGQDLAAAEATRAPYVPLCGERLYLRHAARGHRTAKEWTTDLLRDHVWGGEKITELVRDTLFKDAWLETSRLSHDGANEALLEGAPVRPALAPGYDDDLVDAGELALDVPREAGGRLGVGHWYAVRENPGIFVSAITPAALAGEPQAQASHALTPLDPVESGALAYLVAFDLQQFELGFSLGTEHPRLGWADRLLPGLRDDSLPGPDGIDSMAPLVRTGMLSPAVQGRVAATFTGGFKRQHGAFHAGELARVNHGSHYGFLESGTLLSRLQPGLATALVLESGRVELETWREGDEGRLGVIRHARQNGVALIERDAAGGRSGPGALVTQWGAGNWSGSEDRKLRTLRAGLCLLEQGPRRFLVYGYFSTATPSGMATVFQGYGCSYAMHLDMNALEHTYLALYRHEGSKLLVQHLIEGMSVLDKTAGSQYLPRFVGFPDNRDFFYLLRREPR